MVTADDGDAMTDYLQELVEYLRTEEKRRRGEYLVTGKSAGSIFGEWGAAVELAMKERRAMRNIIREDCVTHGGGDRDEIASHCYLCDKSWHPQGDEEHAPDCLAAP